MMRSRLICIARRALTTVNNTTHNKNVRCYCSPPTSSSKAKLFVGGLSWSLNEKSLKDAFSSYGEVTEVNIIYDRDSGRSRGFGFVHFSKEEDAVCAKDAMDGKALSGRPLRISFALERVRGEPVVVPRLRSTGDYSGRDT
ncbi:hypothetical protein ACOSQ2_002767 [Xanthoceras sorbifolium]